MLGWDIDVGSWLLVVDLLAECGRISGSGVGIWGWGLDIWMSIKTFVDTINCYVSDLEEGEKTLLLYKGEGKLSKVRFRLIYRDFPGVRLCTRRDFILAWKRIGLVL